MRSCHSKAWAGGRRLAAACATALVLTSVACSSTVAAPTDPVTPAATARSTPLPPPAPAAPKVPVGVSGGHPLMVLPPVELAKELDAAKAAGAQWLRVDVDWSRIEGTRNQFDWANTDRVVNAARSRGLLVLAVVTYTPTWAQDPALPANTPHARPASAEVFATFAAQAARHYGQTITSWEIWNEPNLDLFFLPRPDARFYTQMLQASYRAIHAEQPNATVVGGSLAPAADEPDGSRVAPTTFVQQMYTAGAQDSMDAASIHPYSYPANPSDPATSGWNTFYRLRYVRDTMRRYGDGTKALWLTEFGAPTATVRTGAGPVQIDDVRQAEIISDGLRFANELGNIGPVFLYSIRDEDTGSPNLLLNFGLLRTDFSPKPAYSVVKEYTGAR